MTEYWRVPTKNEEDDEMEIEGDEGKESVGDLSFGEKEEGNGELELGNR